MSFWNQASIEPKRQFRWLLYISGMPQFIVKNVKKPSFQVATTNHDFINYKFYYPGRVTWQPITVTIVDPVQPDSTASLVKILESAGYVLPDEYTSQANEPRTISKQAFVDALGGQIQLVQFGANTGAQQENVLEKWSINNPFITSVDFGNLDYSQDELVNISITFQYDWANLELPETTPGKVWTLNPTAATIE
tara:strand:- start:4284 stop:4865 length:582 start_codon:yes stop_codon:yes gene_type:complete